MCCWISAKYFHFLDPQHHLWWKDKWCGKAYLWNHSTFQCHSPTQSPPTSFWWGLHILCHNRIPRGGRTWENNSGSDLLVDYVDMQFRLQYKYNLFIITHCELIGFESKTEFILWWTDLWTVVKWVWVPVNHRIYFSVILDCTCHLGNKVPKLSKVFV